MSKIQVKIKYLYPFSEDKKLKIIPEGDGIDVRSAIDYKPTPPYIDHRRDVIFDFALIPLGFCLELPPGFKADLKPRSGSFKKWGFVQTNSPGLIDFEYNSDTDEWKLPCLFLKEGTEGPIKVGDRIGQFEIILSQKATSEQKKLYMESDGFEFVEVEHLEGSPRGGFGECTGTN